MRHTRSNTTLAVPATEVGGKNGTILQITLHRDAT
jgi:hypothetical protein